MSAGINSAAMELLNELCERYELPASRVRAITITPKEILAEVYATNENGAKYITHAGEVAIDRIHVPFEYSPEA